MYWTIAIITLCPLVYTLLGAYRNMSVGLWNQKMLRILTNIYIDFISFKSVTFSIFINTYWPCTWFQRMQMFVTSFFSSTFIVSRRTYRAIRYKWYQWNYQNFWFLLLSRYHLEGHALTLLGTKTFCHRMF